MSQREREVNKKQRAIAINAKMANRRKNDWHKFSRRLVNQNAAIFVGKVSSMAITKGKGAKSAHDQAWGLFKSLLEYKCNHAGVIFYVVDESYTIQTCSGCGVIPRSSPKGRTGLGIREWTCDDCGESHDRDVNAALNILALGHERLAGGIPGL